MATSGSTCSDRSPTTRPSLSSIASRCARAYRCHRFRGEAAYGRDTLARQTFYGFGVHVRLEWPGVITRFSVAPANAHELAVVPELTEGTHGWLLGDRNSWSPRLRADLLIDLLAPYRSAKRAPWPRWSTQVSYRIATVFGQLVDRCTNKRAWARDLWPLCHRLLRQVLMHTLVISTWATLPCISQAWLPNETCTSG